MFAVSPLQQKRASAMPSASARSTRRILAQCWRASGEQRCVRQTIRRWWPASVIPLGDHMMRKKDALSSRHTPDFLLHSLQGGKAQAQPPVQEGDLPHAAGGAWINSGNIVNAAPASCVFDITRPDSILHAFLHTTCAGRSGRQDSSCGTPLPDGIPKGGQLLQGVRDACGGQARGH